LFGNKKNRDLLIDFINKALSGKHVIEVQYLPTQLESTTNIIKQSIVDVLCTDKNGRSI